MNITTKIIITDTNIISDLNNAKILEQFVELDNVYIIKNVEIPTSIVECGFLSNASEKNKLQNSEYQQKIADTIKNAIINYSVFLSNN